MTLIIKPSELGMAQTNVVNRFISRFMMRSLGLTAFNELCQGVEYECGAELAATLLERLNISVAYTQDSAEMPSGSGCVVVSNLPHGLLDILVALKLLRESNPSQPVKFLANTPFSSIAPFADYALGNGSESTFTLVRRAVDFVKGGGVLVVFPSARVAGYVKSYPDVVDYGWRAGYMKIAKLAAAPIVPMFIYGRNSRKFLFSQIISDPLSRLRLVRELLNKEGSEIPVTIGCTVNYADISKDAERVSDFVKTTLYLLREREQGVSVSQPEIVLWTTSFDGAAGYELPLDVAQIVASGVLIGDFRGVHAYCVDSLQEVKRLFLVDQQAILFSAVIQVSASAAVSERDSVHTMFASHKLFDFSHNKMAYIIDNCLELSDVRYGSDCVSSELDRGLIVEILSGVSKYFAVRYVVISASLKSEYQGNAYDIFVKYLSAHRVGGAFSRYIIPRGLSFKAFAHRPRGFLARNMTGIDTICTLSKLIAQTESVDIKIDFLVSSMFDSGASVASLGVVKGESRGIVSNILLILKTN